MLLFPRLALASLVPALLCSQPPNSDQLLSTGSGFVVSAQGYVITNSHVTKACNDVRVKLSDTVYPAQLVASDVQNDLALLKVNGALASVLVFRDSPRVKLGESVIVVGFPLHGIVASSLNLTTGSVSALAGLGDDARVIQFTAPVQPGNSGGPLLDESGNVVGIVTSKLSALWSARVIRDLPQNVNFAIKSTVVRDFLDSRGVQYQTNMSGPRLETTDIGEKASGAVALIECLGPTSLPMRADPSSARVAPPRERTGPSGESSAFQRGLNAYQQRDYPTALSVWKPLAEQGVSEAQFNIGLMYFDGQGVPQDYAQAASWFEKSAEQDYDKAQLNLSAMYASGKGIRRDYIQAYKWLSLCAAKGNVTCQTRRDFLANQLNRSQLRTAQRLAREWTPKRAQPSK